MGRASLTTSQAKTCPRKCLTVPDVLAQKIVKLLGTIVTFLQPFRIVF